ncbi:unnamed protein product [Litomosoides sigmodontis]|uniref:NAD-dependent epimerase/dehydratase domain-containing protein n=1 Tax=Litomosoides sigmodontis TaxID=42156 RepID=A0A3P6T832_LITSI|nr:unnamed protein product [Litomosoides sigmodontis]
MSVGTKLTDATPENNNCRVLVTGASGYLAIHCVQQLLQQGYKVRGTVRDLNCLEKIHPLQQLANSDRLELFRVTLEDDADAWEKAITDCMYVLHIASPCDLAASDATVQIAVCGTLNVLRVGHKDREKVFTESDWTDLNWKHLNAYHRSKVLAEKAAWNFMEKNPDVSFSLTVLNPSLIVGPSLQSAKGASVSIISRFMDGSMPAYPAMKLGLVDVRDVARAHILAMKNGRCDGQRILITAEALSFHRIADILREEFGKQGYSIPRFRAPYVALWLYSMVDEVALQALPLYEHKDKLNNSKASQLLGLSYYDVRKSLIEMVYDMIERNILPRKKSTKVKK